MCIYIYVYTHINVYTQILYVFTHIYVYTYTFHQESQKRPMIWDVFPKAYNHRVSTVRRTKLWEMIWTQCPKSLQKKETKLGTNYQNW